MYKSDSGTISISSRKSKTFSALVAGGAGFLGSHLCDRLLAEGFTVYCVDNLQTGTTDNLAHLSREPRFSFLEHDVEEALPERLKVDRVYNLACPASPPHYQADPIKTMMTSVMGTYRLLEQARANRARFLQASTSEVYGDPEHHPQRESYWGNVNPTGPRACYDEGKRSGETLCFDFRRLGHADVRVARIFNTYGPRMRPDDGRIVSNLATQALTGAPLTIYGDGSQTRSFCYVSDLVEGLFRLMQVDADVDAPVNLGNPGEFTILELAELVLSLTGSQAPVVHRPLPQDDPRRRRPDISRANEILGWAPKVPLSEGLPPTIGWFAKAVSAPAAQQRRAVTA